MIIDQVPSSRGAITKVPMAVEVRFQVQKEQQLRFQAEEE
jgi:hypothetical protein